jgi:hypothetical protein
MPVPGRECAYDQLRPRLSTQMPKDLANTVLDCLTADPELYANFKYCVLTRDRMHGQQVLVPVILGPMPRCARGACRYHMPSRLFCANTDSHYDSYSYAEDRIVLFNSQHSETQRLSCLRVTPTADCDGRCEHCIFLSAPDRSGTWVDPLHELHRYLHRALVYLTYVSN